MRRRHREIAEHIGRGLRNGAVAQVLAVSRRTVEWHVKNALEKLGLRSRVQLARWVAAHAPREASINGTSRS